MNRILALDPSGTSTTGIFLYSNWNNYQITSFTSENWLEQAQNLKELVKKEQVKIIACETSSLWKKTSYNFHFDKLIKLVGVSEYLSHELGIEYIPIGNHYRNKWEDQARAGKIAGLMVKEERGKGRPKQVWYFKNQKLNEHEKDAVLIFYIYWCKFLKQEWPFID